ARLAAWRALPTVTTRVPMEQSRLVVVDVETSGLNIKKDRLIAIGAVAVVNGRVALADSLEIVLQQDVVSGKANILIHGIGGEVQREGVPPVEALLAFLEYLGKSPLVAFHVAFDNFHSTHSPENQALTEGIFATLDQRGHIANISG
ncbi:MAG: class I tRNA ligase family protein, partial [Oscillochloris sp.]|nr:class I tRNA ligase family protein [Oscillochloris sp.]